MNTPLTIQQRNAVLKTVSELIASEKEVILTANKVDLDCYKGNDISMFDRLKVVDAKIDGMILSLEQLVADSDPIGKELYHFTHDNGPEDLRCRPGSSG